MTPVPSQTPISHESGARSAGRSVGSSSTIGSALAAEEVAQHDRRDEDDREARQTQQADEEEFERHEIHGSHPTARERDCQAEAVARAASPNPTEITPMSSSAPITLPATRKMNPSVRPYQSCTANERSTAPPKATSIHGMRHSSPTRMPIA